MQLLDKTALQAPDGFDLNKGELLISDYDKCDVISNGFTLRPWEQGLIFSNNLFYVYKKAALSRVAFYNFVIFQNAFRISFPFGKGFLIVRPRHISAIFLSLIIFAAARPSQQQGILSPSAIPPPPFRSVSSGLSQSAVFQHGLG